MAILATLTCPCCDHRFKVMTGAGRERICPSCRCRLVVDGDIVRAVQAAIPTSSRSQSSAALLPTAQPMSSAATDSHRRSTAAPPPLPSEQPVPIGRVQPVWMWLAGAGVLGVVAMAVMLPRNRRSVDAKESPSLHRSVAVVRSLNPGRPVASDEDSKPSKESGPAPETAPNPPIPPAGKRSADDPIQASLASVGLVHSPSGHGSGFMAAPKLLVTNVHVIERALVNDIRVRFPDNEAAMGRDFPLSVVVEDPRNDLAVLEVDCDVKPLTIANPYSHTNGQRVVMIGSPGNGGETVLPNFTTDGRLGPRLTGPSGEAWWTLSMAVNSGNSGGPIVDSTNGEVIGVVRARYTQTQSQGIAVPHPELARVLEEARNATKLERQRTDALHRQRWCLYQIADRINGAELVFRTACRAVDSADFQSAADKLMAFEGMKRDLLQYLDEGTALSDSTVRHEITRLMSDVNVDQVALKALLGLTSDRDRLLADVVKPVAINHIKGYIQGLATGFRRAKDSADVLGRRLQVDFDWTSPE